MSNKINRNTILDYNDNTKSNNKPKKKKQDRIQNWTEYNQGLVKRGDITLLVSPAVFLSAQPGIELTHQSILAFYLLF